MAFAADIACVLVFVAAGRRNHSGGITLAGVTETAWPFLVGLSVGWLLSRGWRQPAALNPTGITVWLSAIVAGMSLRAGVGEGIALSFIVVATLVTGALLLGWRALATFAGRGR